MTYTSDEVKILTETVRALATVCRTQGALLAQRAETIADLQAELSFRDEADERDASPPDAGAAVSFGYEGVRLSGGNGA